MSRFGVDYRFEPTSDEKRRLQLRALHKQAESARNDPSLRNAAAKERAGIQVKEKLKDVERDYDAGFTAYLTGKLPPYKNDGPPDTQSVLTPSGWEGKRNQSLMGVTRVPGVRPYVMGRQHKRELFERYIRTLKTWGCAIGYNPETGEVWAPDVTDHYLFYKYVLRRPRGRNDTLGYDYEEDFQQWKQGIHKRAMRNVRSEQKGQLNIHPYKKPQSDNDSMFATSAATYDTRDDMFSTSAATYDTRSLSSYPVSLSPPSVSDTTDEGFRSFEDLTQDYDELVSPEALAREDDFVTTDEYDDFITASDGED